MALIPAKCTQCGANIEVDASQETGICKFCGTTFITEKAINNFNYNFAGANINVVGGDITNLLELAKNALEITNEKDTLKYCEKALEINVKSAEAWFIKMQGEKIRAMKASTNIEKFKSIEEIFVSGNSSIKYENDKAKNSRTRNVHLFYLESVKAFLSNMKVSIECDNVETLKNIANTSKGNAMVADQIFLLEIETKELFIFKLIEQISPNEILENKEFQKLLIECINLYVEFRDCYQNRTLLYSDGPNVQVAKTMKARYESLVSLLPEKKQSEVFEWTSVGKNKGSSSKAASSDGCYVATCVYGSYDCPEVWTLRRFRDNTLVETWHGRLFIKCYYALSPTIVKWFGNTDWFKTFWKKKLDKMVSDLNHKGIENTSYIDKY